MQLANILALYSDQIILEDPSGLIADEVDYSGNWGAQNGQGPNRHTLERLRADAASNEPHNWLYSMVEGGTPGKKNSSHLLRNIYAEPTYLDTIEKSSSTIFYTLMSSATVDIKIYDDKHKLACMLLSSAEKPSGTHQIVWDGKNAQGKLVEGVFTFEVAAKNAEDESLSNSNDTLLKITDVKIYNRAFLPKGEGTAVFTYNLSKPAKVKMRVWNTKKEFIVRNLLHGEVRGAGENKEIWNGRDDIGTPVPTQLYSADAFAEDIFGNVIIVEKPLQILDLKTAPSSSFDPTAQPAPEKQTIAYQLSSDAAVQIEIFDSESKQKVRTLLNNVTRRANKKYQEIWDGKNDRGKLVSNGKYHFLIKASRNKNTVNASGEVTVLRFN